MVVVGGWVIADTSSSEQARDAGLLTLKAEVLKDHFL